MTIEQEMGARGFWYKKQSPLHIMHIIAVFCVFFFNKFYGLLNCFCFSEKCHPDVTFLVAYVHMFVQLDPMNG